MQGRDYRAESHSGPLDGKGAGGTAEAVSPGYAEAKAPYILIIEDNRADVFLIEEAMTLSKVAAKTLVIADGERAIQYLGRGDDTDATPPVLIILDLNLPKRDGFEILRQLRSTRHWSKTPVLMVTSSNAAADRETASSLGASYFTKPSAYDAYLKLGDVIQAMVSRPEDIA